MEKPAIQHAEGCATNLGVIGAKCNCGSEAQRDSDADYYEPLIKEAKAEVARLIICQIKTFLNKPHLYHCRCWGSGLVLIRDEWSETPTYQCHSYDGDFNCGCRKCPWENGAIEGILELQDYERHQNNIIGDIIHTIQSKMEGK